jgi:hypothetical protein
MLNTFGLDISQIDWQISLGTSALFSKCVSHLRQTVASMLLSPETSKELDLIELYLDLEAVFPTQNLMQLTIVCLLHCANEFRLELSTKDGVNFAIKFPVI